MENAVGVVSDGVLETTPRSSKPANRAVNQTREKAGCPGRWELLCPKKGGLGRLP